jgi:hypothetical protein
MAGMYHPTKSESVDASFVAVCTRCQLSETSEYGTYDVKAKFIRHIELNGWRHRIKGWVCPDCVKAVK